MHSDVVVIGAGQAGLSAAYALRRAGADFAVLDGDGGSGGAWQHRWPSLRLDAAHRIHPLPGLALPDADPSAPASQVVADYFADYERRFALPVHRPVGVRSVRRTPGGFALDTSVGEWTARGLVNATGTWTRPFWPTYPGRELFGGRQLHAAEYRDAEEFRGRHVVVVGGGTSAVQQLIEISAVSSTTWVTRREPVWRTGGFDEDAGRAAVALVEERVRAGLPPGSVVGVTGLVETPAVLAARARGVLDRLPLFDRLTADGVVWDGDPARFVPADVVLWATGFRPALEHLAPLRLRTPGGGIAMDGTRVVGEPRLHLVGYGPSASTIGANRAGPRAARELLRALRDDVAA
ncbi:MULTISPECIES: NAD(P)-binding domain-containing protein [unclassified Modestobacter]|uniref:NAD(P)-binding domain-containing protein n=1 Tax=unclassified Modestobacter TaxID=2643866 RepID=UPI0022AAD38B|nr:MULTISPECIES: NAD(P)-binding domain-containing protein [unclassified Modestobacter]MCZ2824411.1 NAD(P)-binding domain-containing protein [Modestobacter sp. VKM Ac-2981]MCZ2854061.1 NAD(P)-binding domain-containing protein [Modestobacter sp. VKM Ac-2982]